VFINKCKTAGVSGRENNPYSLHVAVFDANTARTDQPRVLKHTCKVGHWQDVRLVAEKPTDGCPELSADCSLGLRQTVPQVKARTAHNAEEQLNSFLTSALEGDEVSFTPRPLYPKRKSPR